MCALLYLLVQWSRKLSTDSIQYGGYGRHIADDIFRCIFVNEKFGILIKISLKYAPKGPVDNNPALI